MVYKAVLASWRKFRLLRSSVLWTPAAHRGGEILPSSHLSDYAESTCVENGIAAGQQSVYQASYSDAACNTSSPARRLQVLLPTGSMIFSTISIDKPAAVLRQQVILAEFVTWVAFACQDAAVNCTSSARGQEAWGAPF